MIINRIIIIINKRWTIYAKGQDTVGINNKKEEFKDVLKTY